MPGRVWLNDLGCGQILLLVANFWNILLSEFLWLSSKQKMFSCYNAKQMKGKVCLRPKWPIWPALISAFSSTKRPGVFLDGMLVQRRVTLSFKFGGTHLTAGVNDWSTVRVKVSYPRTKHNVRSQGSNPDPRSGVERTNHEATAPPTNE